jgi:hypothetical protein
MKNTFIILWAQHAAFMDPLFENGTVVLGGLFADATGSVVVVEAENELAVQLTWQGDHRKESS